VGTPSNIDEYTLKRLSMCAKNGAFVHPETIILLSHLTNKPGEISSHNQMAAGSRLQVQSWIFSSFTYFSNKLCAVILKVLGL